MHKQANEYNVASLKLRTTPETNNGEIFITWRAVSIQEVIFGLLFLNQPNMDQMSVAVRKFGLKVRAATTSENKLNVYLWWYPPK